MYIDYTLRMFGGGGGGGESRPLSLTPWAGIWHCMMTGECHLTTPPNLLATKPGAQPMVESRYERQA